MTEATFQIDGNSMYQADYDRNAAILFLVGQLDIQPEEVTAARIALGMDPTVSERESANAPESDGGEQ